ncbi:15385_t:CDS:2, partial [Entrophospora sp. SA101]
MGRPANFGGGKKPEIIAKQLFPQKFPANKSFSQRKLSKSELQEFKRALEAEATWCWDKEVLAVYHIH